MKQPRRNLFSKSDKKSFLFVYCLIAIPVIQFLIFWVYVHADSFFLAFMDDATGEITFKNFITVWDNIKNTDSTFNIPKMVGRSLILWVTTNIIAFPFGLMSTYVLYRRVVGHYAFRVIYTIPALVGGVIWVTMVKSISSSDGIIVYILQKLNVPLDNMVLNQGLFFSEKTAFPTLVFLAFFTGIVGGSVIATGAFTKVPPELMDSAKIDGLGFWGSFFNVALPCAWPTLSTLLTIALCGIFVADSNVFLFSNSTGEPAMATMGYYLYYLTWSISNSSSAVLPYGYPAALGLVISGISIPVVLLGRRILTKVIPTVEL